MVRQPGGGAIIGLESSRPPDAHRWLLGKLALDPGCSKGETGQIDYRQVVAGDVIIDKGV